MAKSSKSGSERGPFPERLEVPFYHFLRAGLKWLTRKTLNGIEKAAPGLFLAVAWIYTKESAENLKRWTEGTILAGGLLAENMADILPLPTWFRKTVESVASDLPLNITEYFNLRAAKNNINFPLDYQGPKPEDVKKTLNDFAAQFLEGFRRMVSLYTPFFAKLRERWLHRRAASREFKEHSFKTWRALLIDLMLISPPDIEELEHIWNHELTTQDRWNLQESPEYLGTPERIRGFLSMTPAQRRMWLDQQDHDDWFNFLSPKMKQHLKTTGDTLNRGVNNLAAALEADADKDERELNPPRLTRSRLKQLIKNKFTLGWIALVILVGGVYFAAAGRNQSMAINFVLMFVLTAVAWGGLVIIIRNTNLEQQQLRQKESSNG